LQATRAAGTVDGAFRPPAGQRPGRARGRPLTEILLAGSGRGRIRGLFGRSTRPESTYSSPGRMATDDGIGCERTGSETLPHTVFRVPLENGHELIAHTSGRMRENHLRIPTGDRVKVDMTPYDLTKGRITYRHR